MGGGGLIFSGAKGGKRTPDESTVRTESHFITSFEFTCALNAMATSKNACHHCHAT
jgi:hypothetical protein